MGGTGGEPQGTVGVGAEMTLPQRFPPWLGLLLYRGVATFFISSQPAPSVLRNWNAEEEKGPKRRGMGCSPQRTGGGAGVLLQSH